MFSHVAASFQLADAFDTMERRPLLTSMDDDYASYALSQRMSFEHAFAAILTAALELNDERVLRVVDQGAADGVNSHLLIRTLVAMRAGRPLVRRHARQRMGSRGAEAGRTPRFGRRGGGGATRQAPPGTRPGNGPPRIDG